MIDKKLFWIIISVGLLTFVSCGNDKKRPNQPDKIEVKETPLKLTFLRFEKDVFEPKADIDSLTIKQLKEKYGKFFDLWCFRLSGILPPTISNPSDAYIAFNLNQYRNDKYINEVYGTCQAKFDKDDWMREELTPAFKIYATIFPGKIIPEIITYVSPFTSNIMAMDSAVGIGLHFYLGNDYKYYPSLQMPRYMTRKFSKEYMASDLLRGWLDSEYNNDSVQKNCLSQIIYAGKNLYALDLLLPDTDDSIKIGYTSSQIEWAYANEQKIWAFLIDQKLLYSMNAKLYMKYINDGMTTSGFPTEAPAKLGAFIGWQIIRSYMMNNKNVSLQDLYKIQDAQIILASSAYKPTKPKS
ncbi:hypothetical protein BH11BAC2_BH11BAC2_13160 [soil metagenome]